MSYSKEERLDKLGDLIANSPHNLVSAKNRSMVKSHHIPECLEVCKHLKPGRDTHWIDLGTGGGLPGLVCAIVFPNVGWTLIDSVTKKINAIDQFIDELELENCRAISGRAEVLARDVDFRGLYSGVISRAVARLDIVTELSRGFIMPGGKIVAIKGPGVVQERGHLQKAMGHLKVHEKDPVKLSFEDREINIVTLVADGPVPEMIPRKDGVPANNPLGGPKTTPQENGRSND